MAAAQPTVLDTLQLLLQELAKTKAMPIGGIDGAASIVSFTPQSSAKQFSTTMDFSLQQQTDSDKAIAKIQAEAEMTQSLAKKAGKAASNSIKLPYNYEL